MSHATSLRLILPALSLLAAAGLAGIAVALEPPAKDTATATPSTPAKAAPTLLDPIKTLAGEWEMTDDEGKAQLGSVFRVVAAGSAVCETMMPGTPYEMVNMYHLDGPDTLVITHYCAVGNQPRMTGHAPKTPGTYEFTIKDAAKDVSNLASPDGMYMGQLTLIIKDQDHIVQDWVHTDKGKPGGKVSFELTRKPSAKQSAEDKQIRDLLVRARELQRERKYDEASKVVDEILAINPQNPAGLLLRDVLQSQPSTAKK